jgi:hypothetical protein
MPESSGGQIRSFPLSVLFHHGSPYSYMSWRINYIGFLVAAVQKHSLTPLSSSSSSSHLILCDLSTRIMFGNEYII